jgi:hypothetical protein
MAMVFGIPLPARAGRVGSLDPGAFRTPAGRRAAALLDSLREGRVRVPARRLAREIVGAIQDMDALDAALDSAEAEAKLRWQMGKDGRESDHDRARRTLGRDLEGD